MSDVTMEIAKRSELEALLAEMNNCGGRLSALNEDIENANRAMSQVWTDEKNREFSELLARLVALNEEALDELGAQMGKFETFITDMGAASAHKFNR